jgi:hypothetical protein
MDSTPVAKQSGFALQPQNIQEAMELARMLASSSMVPKNYANKPDDTLVAMMMGAELRLNPIQSLQNIAVINGRPAIYGDALLALMQNHPSFGGIKETFDDSTMSASCTVWRKGGERHTQIFSQADAKTAGLWGKSGPWTQYPKRMLQWRARGFAIRSQFADALAGLITQDEAEDLTTAEPRNVTPEPAKVEYYPADQFDKNLASWKTYIQAGKKSADQIIAMVESKGELTEEQKQTIKNCEVIEGEQE